jgi:hypothetical protein
MRLTVASRSVTAATTMRRSVGAASGLAGLAVVVLGMWALLIEDGGEGPVLVSVTTQHGLHRGDLAEVGLITLGLALVGLGAWLARARR